MSVFDTKHQRAAWLLALLGVLILVALLPYASGLLGAPVLYVAVSRWHERLVRRIRNRSLAASITIVLVLLGLILPLIWMVTLLVGHAPGVAKAILSSPLLQRIGTLQVGGYTIGPQLKQAGSDTVSFLAGNAFALLGTATRITLNLVLTVFGLFYLLRDPEAAWRAVRPFIPFSDSNVAALGERFAAVTKATIIGTGLGALIQGVMTAIAFSVFGLPDAVFWGAVVVVFSLLPILGSGMVWIPAAAYLFSSGRVGAAVGMVIFGLTMAVLVDYMMRPFVSNKYAHIHPLITLAGAVAGVSYLGILGLLIGPLALLYFFELLSMYQIEYLPKKGN